MAEIILKQPGGPYKAIIDTEALDVEVRKAYLGVSLITENGEKLSVAMRDDGFEVRYTGDFGDDGFDMGYTEFKNGIVRGPDE